MHVYDTLILIDPASAVAAQQIPAATRKRFSAISTNTPAVRHIGDVVSLRWPA